ncbi:putative cyclase domain containing protein [Hyaloscypha variabilis]
MDTPKFTELPNIPNGPKGCAWSVWNKIHEEQVADGKKDMLGTLNHLTPAVVAAAAAEIKTGSRAALNWGLDAYTYVGFHRQKLEFKAIDARVLEGVHFYANDDQITFNTQISSQWDGVCHFGHQKTGCYYNGITHEEMQQPREQRPSSVDGWTKAGGIAGRGVLLDYARWAQEHGVKYSPASATEITINALEKVAAWEGVTFTAGDILLFRTGWLRWHNDADDETRIRLTRDKHENVGVAASEATAAWIWDHRLAGVAADNPTLESWPPNETSPINVDHNNAVLHEYMLTMLGCPIGELWDLEALSELCASSKRWSFFLTSAPINIRGCIATPANAMAVL